LPPSPSLNKGTAYALAAYLIWGFLPLYWKSVTDVPALETTAHRIWWSFVFLMFILLLSGRWRAVAQAIRRPDTWYTFILSGALLLANWLVYMYAMNQSRIVESSLGYFINPLANVLLGVLFLHERLRPGQWISIALAGAGVLYLTISFGAVPWIALALASTFAFYGLLRKTARLNSLDGQSVEMTLFGIPLGIYLLVLFMRDDGAFTHISLQHDTILIMGGIVTTVPLLFFSAGARLVPLSLMGVLQYLAPTIQFILGVFLFQEPFGVTQLVGFGLIWSALLLFTVEGLVTRRRLAMHHTGIG
jgi:chloramphenicol-sensitive protein RarD